MVAVLKFFKRNLLLNRKLDWAETWWEASQWHRDSELIKSFHSNIQDGLKFFKQHLFPNHKSDWAETWWEASKHYRVPELLKSFYSNIQDMATILKFFKAISQTVGWIEPKLDGKYWSNRDSELLKLLRSNIQDSRHGGHLEILQTTSPPNSWLDWAKTWWEALERHRDWELLKLFRSSIQDGRHGGHMAAILKFFKRHLLPNRRLDWAKTWWEALELHRDSELLKLFCSNIQDGHHGGHMAAILKFSNSISSQTVSLIEPKLDGKHLSYIEIQNCLNHSVWLSMMAHGSLGGYLENLETASAPEP